MGVTGLLPFLKKSTDQINLSQLAGSTAAIDAYVWLHRGAFSCADKLAMGEKTTSYIYYGIKMLNLLLSHNIKPILVFDGRRLEAKKDTEIKRHELRKQNREKADELLRAGRENEARDYMRRSVDINHVMALELIKAARKMKVDCIVAPHEADAQLAFLNRTGIAQFVITEDSDLILFGCNQILYKLDPSGNGLLLRMDRLNLSLGRPHDSPTTLLVKLRHMCILSGCDYVNSLPGVGLVKAKKFVMASSDPDICRSLKRLPLFLNLKVKIDEEYIERVRHAELTFQKQLVFDPHTRTQVTMDGNEVTNDEPYSGVYLDPKTALDLALGNIDPFTMQKLDFFDPDTLPETSIWHKSFAPPKPKEKTNVSAFITTKSKEVVVETKKVITVKPKIATKVNFSPVVSDQDLIALYSTKISERSVKQTEVKTSISDGIQTREVIQSSYFVKQNVEAKLSSPENFIQKTEVQNISDVETCEMKKTPRKITNEDIIGLLDDNSTAESLQQTPKKASANEIMCIIGSSPPKLHIDKSPLSSNPFAKRSPRKSPKLNQHLKNIICLGEDFDCSESLNQSYTESPSDEVLADEPNDSADIQLSSTDTVEQGIALSQCTLNSQSSGVSSADSGSQLDSFRYRRPLFKKKTDNDVSQDCQLIPIVPKSPVLGKRKKSENFSQLEKRVCSSYFNNIETKTTSLCTTQGSVTSNGKRSLSSLLDCCTASTQEHRINVSSQSTFSSNASSKKIIKQRHSVGLSRSTKINAQSSLYKFGFTKK